SCLGKDSEPPGPVKSVWAMGTCWSSTWLNCPITEDHTSPRFRFGIYWVKLGNGLPARSRPINRLEGSGVGALLRGRRNPMISPERVDAVLLVLSDLLIIGIDALLQRVPVPTGRHAVTSVPHVLASHSLTSHEPSLWPIRPQYRHSSKTLSYWSLTLADAMLSRSKASKSGAEMSTLAKTRTADLHVSGSIPFWSMLMNWKKKLVMVVMSSSFLKSSGILWNCTHMGTAKVLYTSLERVMANRIGWFQTWTALTGPYAPELFCNSDHSSQANMFGANAFGQETRGGCAAGNDGRGVLCMSGSRGFSELLVRVFSYWGDGVFKVLIPLP
ncbi:hypothetical protein LINGRAHAP2_LOCUS7567, partial [Linum grandiflorum]